MYGVSHGRLESFENAETRQHQSPPILSLFGYYLSPATSSGLLRLVPLC